MSVSARLANRLENDDDFFSNHVRSLVGPHLLAAALNHTPTSAESRIIALDVIEKPDRYEIKADLPGVKEDKINIQVDGDVLNLSVANSQEKSDTKEKDGVRIHRQERSSSFARRAVRLPESADLEKIQADLDSGVLMIDVPKKKETSKQRIIKIGKAKNGQ